MMSMKIHVISETVFHIKGNGVHTAFIDHIDLLKSQNDIEVMVNDDVGKGDVFHSHTYGPYYFLKGLRYKHKRVLTVHVIPDSIKGSLPNWPLLMPFVKWYLKKVYAYADVCIAISPRVEEAIIESGAHTKIARINNPIFIEKWHRTDEDRKKGRALLGVKEDAFVVLGVGQLQARKGVEDFVDISEQLPDAEFIWVGGRPFKAMTEGIPRIDERMKHVKPNMHFAGMFELEKMPLVYAAADLMLFPSYQENCPLAPIEAAVNGIPVIFRDITEYVSLYENPYLKAKTTDAFVEMTRQMMTSPACYQEGVSISKQLITQFEKNMILKKLRAVYEGLIKGV
jgi:1,2-diacylglycerol-3-alpha-glucose alpha-1,2-galactosyltransferase